MTSTPLRLALAFATLLAAATARAEDSVLTVDTVAGSVAVERDGKRLALKVGDALQEQDLIVTQASGRLTLRFARHGFLDVGPNTEAGVERLPFAAYAKDLKSIFSVSRGYLRVVWKHPQLSTNWPLYIYMSGHRISLTAGEYFFQHNGDEQLACTAAGQLALQAVGADGVETIRPPACSRLVAGVPPQTLARNPDDWIDVRRGYSLTPGAGSVLAAAPTPAPAPVAAPPPPARAPSGFDSLLSEQPGLSTSSSSGPGPVSPAPVLPAPAGAPRPGLVGVAPSTPIRAPAPTPVLPAPVVAAPTPPPATPPPGMGGGRDWALNVASYADAASAERQAAQLRGAGYPVSVQPATVNGRNWYRVQVPGYASQQAAKAAAQELQSKLGLKGVWVVRPS